MLHFTDQEFARRRAMVETAKNARELDAVLLFAPESQYWLTGYDTFGYCFFQCLIVDDHPATLLTRSADKRQAELTSNIHDIRIWKDQAGANPAVDLAALIRDRGLMGKRIGIELDTHGLTAASWRRVEAALADLVTLVDVSDMLPTLRLVKSPEEISYVREAGRLADRALDAAMNLIAPGADEADILAVMQGAVFAGGGDYPGNPFIIGSGDHALLCRYQSGRRKLAAQDQITLEWAGVSRHYHAAMMRTVVVGDPRPQHVAMHDAAHAALLACEAAMQPDQPMADVFAAHADILDQHGLSEHRLNACGYALGARYAPSWMEPQMFYEGATTVMAPGMVFFLHMILMDSDSGTAMTLGRTSLIGQDGAEPLSQYDLTMLTA